MNDFRYYSLLKEKIEGSSKVKEFMLYAMGFFKAPYVWGNEELRGTDCSGLVCGPLMFMGYDIRTTADDLMRTYCKPYVKGGIELIFATDDTGKARHVGILVNENVVYHASGNGGVKFSTYADFVEEYKAKYKGEIKSLDLSFELCKQYDGRAYGKDGDYV